eukprot:m.174560 g.174560  ORF g.174560 m.174560 type:complete len:573 (+) comp15322_c1_seq6:142-1860(+)
MRVKHIREWRMARSPLDVHSATVASGTSTRAARPTTATRTVADTTSTASAAILTAAGLLAAMSSNGADATNHETTAATAAIAIIKRPSAPAASTSSHSLEDKAEAKAHARSGETAVSTALGARVTAPRATAACIVLAGATTSRPARVNARVIATVGRATSSTTSSSQQIAKGGGRAVVAHKVVDDASTTSTDGDRVRGAVELARELSECARVATVAPLPAATATATDGHDLDVGRASCRVARRQGPGAARREGGPAVVGGESRVRAAGRGWLDPLAVLAQQALAVGGCIALDAGVAVRARPSVDATAGLGIGKGRGCLAAALCRHVHHDAGDLRGNETQVALVDLVVKLRVEGVGIRAGDQVRHSLLDERSGGVGIELGGQLGGEVVVGGLGDGHGVDHAAATRVNHREVIDIHLLVEGVLERVGLAAVDKLRHHLGDLCVDGAEAGLVHLVGELLGKSVLGTIDRQQRSEDVLDDGDANGARQHCCQALLKDSGVVHVGGQAGRGGSALGAGLENLGGKGVLGCHDAVDQTFFGRGGTRCLHQQRGREGRLGGGGAVVLNPNFDAQASLGR